MSNTIQIKRSSTAAAVPTAGQLAVGELAVNLADRKLFTKNASNVVVPVTNAPDSGFSFRNRIINGDMRIDQRNAGASVTANDAVFGVDRFQVGASQSSKGTLQQNAGAVTPPTSFTNYLGFTSSSAYSITSSDFFVLMHKIEGFNMADFGWGTASAQSVTLSFWVRSSLTGTFGGSLENADNNRSYPFSYTISAANTWEQKTLTIAGDTTGTWGTTNGLGANIRWGLGVGSTRSGTAGSWSSTRYFSATGATSVVGINGATFFITGVQLEAGSVATPFERRPFGTELALCQRYYWKQGGNVSPAYFSTVGSAFSTTQAQIPFTFPVQMRAAPSLDAVGGQIYNPNAGATALTAASLDGATTLSGLVRVTVASGLTVDKPYSVNSSNGNHYFAFSSEL
jgi:hypothetical protein